MDIFQRHTNGQQAHEKLLITGIQVNPQWGITSYLSEWLLSKSQKKKKKAKTHVFEDVERRLLSWTIDRNVNWYSHYGKQYRDSSKKNCNYFFIQQLHFQVFIRWKEKHRFQKKLNIPMFIAALFTIGNK